MIDSAWRSALTRCCCINHMRGIRSRARRTAAHKDTSGSGRTGEGGYRVESKIFFQRLRYRFFSQRRGKKIKAEQHKNKRSWRYARQARRQVFSFGGQKNLRGKNFFYDMFQTKFSGHKNIWGALPLNDRPAATGLASLNTQRAQGQNLVRTAAWFSCGVRHARSTKSKHVYNAASKQVSDLTMCRFSLRRLSGDAQRPKVTIHVFSSPAHLATGPASASQLSSGVGFSHCYWNDYAKNHIKKYHINVAL